MSQEKDRLIFNLAFEFEAFLLDREAKGRSPKTVLFYRDELRHFLKYLNRENVSDVCDITPTILRNYFLELGNTRNKGGVHAAFRTIKAFFNWFIEENDLDFRNPIGKVKLPPPSKDPIPGIPISDVEKLVRLCGKDFLGCRDRALLWFLADTGLRRQETVDLNVEDIDLKTGTVVVRCGKGGKARTSFMGVKTSREVSRYLRFRKTSPGDPLWVTGDGGRLTQSGLRQIVRRKAEAAGMKEPGLHAFRRTFAIESLRNGCDVYSLMRLMGHRDAKVLNRYLALVDEDLHKAHKRSSPVDNI